MDARTLVAALVLAATLAGCAAPADPVEPVADVPPLVEPFLQEGVWWVEPSTNGMSRFEAPLDLVAGHSALRIDVAARSTYVVDAPWTGEAIVEVLDPDGEVAATGTLKPGATSGSYEVDAPRAGAWTLVLQAYGGSGSGMGDSISWRAAAE